MYTSVDSPSNDWLFSKHVLATDKFVVADLFAVDNDSTSCFVTITAFVLTKPINQKSLAKLTNYSFPPSCSYPSTQNTFNGKLVSDKNFRMIAFKFYQVGMANEF